MSDKRTCQHAEIVPASGGYYLQCLDCKTLWVHKAEMGKENEWAMYPGVPVSQPTKWKRCEP